MTADENGDRSPEQMIADWEARMAAKRAADPKPVEQRPVEVAGGGVVLNPRKAER